VLRCKWAPFRMLDAAGRRKKNQLGWFVDVLDVVYMIIEGAVTKS
jgi:hypothetical protein